MKHIDADWLLSQKKKVNVKIARAKVYKIQFTLRTLVFSLSLSFSHFVFGNQYHLICFMMFGAAVFESPPFKLTLNGKVSDADAVASLLAQTGESELCEGTK